MGGGVWPRDSATERTINQLRKDSLGMGRKGPHNRLSCFNRKYEKMPSGCWEWRAATGGNGYGIFWNGERTMVAHRWAYEQFTGPIPDGLELDHLCRNRCCVNPSHLEPVTHRENGLRGIAGQHRIEWPKTNTECVNGHTLDEENTRTGFNPDGRTYRVCKTCKRENRRKFYKKHSAKINAKKRLARLRTANV